MMIFIFTVLILLNCYAYFIQYPLLRKYIIRITCFSGRNVSYILNKINVRGVIVVLYNLAIIEFLKMYESLTAVLERTYVLYQIKLPIQRYGSDCSEVVYKSYT